MNRKRYIFILTLVVCLAAAIAASALDVTEPPDFPGGVSYFNPSIGTLDPGANTISGSLNGLCYTDPVYGRSCNPGNPAIYGDTQDSPNFTVPDGYQITSITVTTSNVTGPSGFSATMSLDKPNPTPPTLTNEIPTTYLTLNGSTGNLVSNPIAAGMYALSVFGQNAFADGPFSLNWSVSINIASTAVTPAVAVTNLINLIANPYSGLVLTAGQANSLTDKLNNALASIQAGQNKQAINQLQAFINAVQTYLKTGKIDTPTATTLTVAANAIITSLQ